MTYDTYRYIFIGAAILSAIAFVVAVVLFVVLKIPRVIGDLTGATARKAIRDIREQNEQSGEKVYKASAVNRERGRLTDKISPSGQIIPQHDRHTGMTGMMSGTEKIGTEVLMADMANETSVLDENMAGETSVLSENVVTESVFVIEYEITMINTDEIIEMEAV